jgi:hypothetical protein
MLVYQRLKVRTTNSAERADFASAAWIQSNIVSERDGSHVKVDFVPERLLNLRI